MFSYLIIFIQVLFKILKVLQPLTERRSLMCLITTILICYVLEFYNPQKHYFSGYFI